MKNKDENKNKRNKSKRKRKKKIIITETNIELVGKTYIEPDTIARRRDIPRSTLPTKIKALPSVSAPSLPPIWLNLVDINRNFGRKWVSFLGSQGQTHYWALEFRGSWKLRNNNNKTWPRKVLPKLIFFFFFLSCRPILRSGSPPIWEKIGDSPIVHLWRSILIQQLTLSHVSNLNLNNKILINF